jgi:hypothetical protein
VLCLLLIALLTVSLAAADNAAPAIAPLTGTVPFRLYQGYVIVVQGSIAGRDSLNLMLDTGANPTVIDSRLARERGIAGKDVSLLMHNARAIMQFAEAPSIEMGPLRRTQHKVLLRDLSHMRSHVGIPIHAIVGLDVFGNHSFTIDYEHSRLIFGTPEPAFSAPFETEAPFITLSLRSGREPLQLLVDTGTPGLMLFHSRVRGRALHLRFQGSAETRNLGGWFRLDRVTLDELSLGDSTLKLMPAVVANDRTDWGRTFDGLLGPAALGLKRLSFDFERRTVGWTR